jgi:hypothetical protein
VRLMKVCYSDQHRVPCHPDRNHLGYKSGDAGSCRRNRQLRCEWRGAGVEQLGTEGDQMDQERQRELLRNAATEHGGHLVADHNKCSYDTGREER